MRDNKHNMSDASNLFVGLNADAIRFADADARRRMEPLLSDLTKDKWTVVKNNSSRTVYRFDGTDLKSSQGDVGVLYLKHFHSSSLFHRLLGHMGLSDARCEMKFSRRLSEKGVAVQKVLAAYRHKGVEWLISDGIEPSVPLDKWHTGQLSLGNHSAIRSATVALAELVGKMHACGVIHRDLHCGNILVRHAETGTGKKTELVLMDLHRMLGGRRLSRRSRAANLSQLYHDRRLWTTQSQRLRFLRNYLCASGAEGTIRGWVRLIGMFAGRHSRRLYAQRDRRIFANNRYFSRLGIAGWHTHVILASKRHIPGSAACGHTFTTKDWEKNPVQPGHAVHQRRRYGNQRFAKQLCHSSQA